MKSNIIRIISRAAMTLALILLTVATAGAVNVTVNISGGGTVKLNGNPVTSGSSVSITENYTLTMKPAKGCILQRLEQKIFKASSYKDITD